MDAQEQETTMQSFLEALAAPAYGQENRDAFHKGWDALVDHFPNLTSSVEKQMLESHRLRTLHQTALKVFKEEAERSHLQAMHAHEIQINDKYRVTQIQRDLFFAVIFSKSFYK